MITQPKPDEIIVGDNVTLRCMITRPKYSYVFWKINDTFITFGDDPSPGYQTQFSASRYSKIFDLTIIDISVNQSGTYICRTQRSSWNYMTNREAEVRVNVQIPQPPSFGPATTNGRVFKITRSSENLQLICDPQGVPQPTVSWYKVCREAACNRTSVSLAKDTNVFNVSLYDTKHSGFYECEIANRVESIKRQFQVIITEPDQAPPVALAVCLAAIALVSACLGLLVVRYYLKSRRMVRNNDTSRTCYERW